MAVSTGEGDTNAVERFETLGRTHNVPVGAQPNSSHIARQTPSSRSRLGPADWLVAVGLVGFSAFLRRHGLAPSSLWLDDAWVAAGASVARWDQLLWTGLVSPGFSVLLRLFIAVGGSEPVAAQALPLTAGAVAPALIFLMLGKQGCRRTVALVAALALAVAPMHVRYSVFVKQYTVEAVLSVALLWCAWTIVSDGFSRRRWLRLLVVAGVSFAISAAVAPVIVGTVGVAFWYARKEVEDRRWVGLTSVTATAGALAWGFLVVLPRTSDSLRRYWGDAYVVTDAGVGSAVESVGDRFGPLMSGFSVLPVGVSLGVFVVAVIVVLWRRAAIGVLVISPLVLASLLAVAHAVPLGTGRTDIYLYPCLIVLLAVALDAFVAVLPSVGQRIVLGLVLVATLLAPLALKPTRYFPQDVRSLIADLSERRVDGDAIVLYPPTRYAFALYSGLPVRLVPSTEVAVGWTVEFGDPDVTVLPSRRDDPASYEPVIADAAEGHDRVWFFASHMSPTDYPAARAYLTEQGLSMTEEYKAPGARLELWSRVLDGDAASPLPSPEGFSAAELAPG